MSARWKEWLIRAALVIGVPVFVFGGTELLLRAAGAGFDPSFWVPVPGEAAFATNDLFGRRFFPQGLARTPAPDKVASDKSPSTRRVFILGESAAMGFPEPALGLAPMLEHMLRSAQPQVGWQVHNAAMTAINSHVMVPIARDSAQLAPDVFVVLAGNNEAVGPYGPATVFGHAALPGSLVRAVTFASATRSGQVLTRLLQRDQPREWRGLEMFVQQRIPASDARLAGMYQSFRENLSEVVRTGRKVGARVLLVTVPVNLKDCPPFADTAGQDATNEFRRGTKLIAEGRTDEALRHFRSARDYDLLRVRADSTINDIIRKIAPSEGATLVDAEQHFGATGADMFWEHVHFTPNGTFTLATHISRALGVHNTPRMDRVRATLPITGWDERNLRLQVAAMLRRPPFTGQQGNAQRLAALQMTEDVDAIRRDSRQVFETAVSSRPADVHLLGRYASLLRESGDAKAAAAVLTRMLQLIPDRKAWHVSRGAALSDAGQQETSVEAHKAALALDPEFDLAHFGIGVANARLGRHQEAVQNYSEALRFNPSYIEAAYNMAGSLAALGKVSEARAQLERIVAMQPESSRAQAALAQLHAREGRGQDAIRHYRAAVAGDLALPEAHYDLGVLLARQGSLPEAIVHFRQAVHLRPDYADALNNLGIALARQGDVGAAADAFSRALSIRPSFEAARANLERVRRALAAR
ncbi:MAG TPA: tetratricopeptide repeat protein [Bryobacteraceae bacterium]|nr:tetratricopeptide repeat protein [Bryobacteraceae bacterium]